MEQSREYVGYPSRDEVCRLNKQMIDTFGGGWMPPDNIDYNLPLDSILVEIQRLHPYITVKEKAAALAFTIIEQQVFYDGNKRTGLQIAYEFIGANGSKLDLTDNKSLEALAEAIVYGESDYDTLLTWFQEHQEDH